MSEKPQIKDLTPEQVKQLLAADYLEELARMIRQGQLTGFSLDWNEALAKPQGVIQIKSEELRTALELRMTAAVAKHLEETKGKESFAVEDLQADYAKHGKCNNPACMACNSPNKA